MFLIIGCPSFRKKVEVTKHEEEQSVVVHEDIEVTKRGDEVKAQAKEDVNASSSSLNSQGRKQNRPAESDDDANVGDDRSNVVPGTMKKQQIWERRCTASVLFKDCILLNKLQTNHFLFVVSKNYYILYN